MNNAPIALIYAGGTFGSHGTPLSTLPAEQFLPILTEQLSSRLSQISIIRLGNAVVKDSSNLSPADFAHFYGLIAHAQQAGIKKIVLITGTDTLAYLSAFLHYALVGIDISVVVTGSMSPLLYADRFEINHQSDAWSNLSNALSFLQNNDHTGVFVSFTNQILYGNSVQKISASDTNAFVGKAFDPQLPNLPTHIPRPIILSNHDCPIYALYTLPNMGNDLAKQLQFFATQPPTAVLLIGLGAGNLVQSPSVVNAISALVNQGFLVIMTSQCPFGERSTTYQAGAWQYELGVVSGGNLPIPALYGQALWLCLTQPIENRKALWKI